VRRAARLFEHHFALARPLVSGAGSWSTRRSLLLVLEDDAGHSGLGEAAPLPGFSPDTLETARDELQALFGRELPTRNGSRKLAENLREASSGLASPAARAALESALLDLWAREAGVPAWQLFDERDAPAELALCAWLPEGAAAAVADARRAQARGVNAFKVKLDARSVLARGVESLEALRRTLGPGVQLRADVNRSATSAELEPVLGRLRALELEWLEEPTSDRASTPLGLPVALDESLQPSGSLPPFAALPEVTALVLKPTALGGIARCLELAEHARTAKRTAVASHALEGPAGYMAAAALALGLGPSPAHGLAPHAGLRGFRPVALDPARDTLVPWRAPGLGLSVDQALAGAELDRELRP
jgi:o-succinylbenzoate synthase